MIPRYESAEAFARLKAASAVPLARYSNPVFAANELARTPFVPLLQKADVAVVAKVAPNGSPGAKKATPRR